MLLPLNGSLGHYKRQRKEDFIVKWVHREKNEVGFGI